MSYPLALGGLPATVWTDLVGVPWVAGGRDPRAGLDCVGLVVEVCARRGRPIGDPAHGDLGMLAWDHVGWDDLEPGDVILMGRRGVDHVGIYLGRDRVIHAPEHAEVTVTRLAAIQRGGSARGAVRPPANGAPGLGSETCRVSCANAATLVLMPDPFGAPREREIRTLVPGERVVDALPPHWDWDRVQIVGRDGVAPRDTWDGLRAEAGQNHTAMLLPQGPAVGIVSLFLPGSILQQLPRLAMHTAYGVGAYGGLMQALTPSLPGIGKQREEFSNPAFDLDGLRNTAAPYLPIATLYGEHRVAGNIIQAFFRADVNDVPILHMLVAPCAGPIESIAGITAEADGLEGLAIPEDIEIDGNPARNFEGCRVSVRLGESDQTPIAGFQENVSSQSVNATLLQLQPYEFTTTQTVDAFEVLVEFPDGLVRIGTQGGLNDRTCNLRVRWRKEGVTTWNSQNWDVTRNKVGAFTVLQRIDVSADPGIYEIEVTRIAPVWPETDLQNRSQSIWATVNEITYDDLSYPGTALLGLQIASTDQIRGRVPTVTMKAKGSKVWVWDGVSTTNPAFTFQWSDNPAWCVMDMLLNPMYGLARGGRFTLDNIDLQSFQDWADLCDTTPDVNGAASTEKRATLDVVLTQEEDAWDVIQTIAEGAWAQVMVVGDQVSVVLQTTQSDVGIVQTANVKEFTVSRDALSIRPNWIEVQFQNEDADYTLDQVPRQDDTSLLTNNDPQLVETFRAVGVTRTVQAARLAQFRLNFARNATRTIEFSAGPELIHLLPGDVVRVSHDGATWGTSGRVRSSASSTITLDRPVTLSDGDKILVRTGGTGADVLQERTVSVGGSDVTVTAGTAITVTSSWDGGDLPAAGDPWSAGPSSTYSRRYRIRSIETESDLTRRFVAVEYAASLYDDDPGDVPESTDYLPLSTDLPDDLTDVSVHEIATVAVDGSTSSTLEVHFRRGRGWEYVEAFYRILNDDDDPGASDAWVYYGQARGDRIEMRGLPSGAPIEVSVVPVSPAGTRKHPEDGARAVYRFKGRSRKHPSLPSGITIGQSADSIRLYLPVPTEADVDQYEVRAGASWVVARRVAILPPGDHTLPLFGIGSQTILVRARNRSRAVSLDESSLSLTGATQDYESSDIDADEETTSWSGTSTNTTPTDASTVLELDTASALTGTYVTPTRSNADGTARLSKVRITVEPVLDQVAMTWDEAGFPWLSGQAGVTWAASYLTGFEAQEFETWDEAAFPWSGYLATLRTWDGPVDVADEMQTQVEWGYSTDNGSSWSSYERYLPREETVDSLRARLTLTSVHERLVPRVTSTRLTADYVDVASSTHTHDDRYYTETELDAGQLDNRYYRENEHVNSSAGAGDAGKPVVLDAAGHIDASMVNDADIDHGSVGGLTDDDHSQYLHDTPGSSARNQVKPTDPGAIPLTLQANLAQTANLFQIDSAVTPAVCAVDKTGKLAAYGLDASSQKLTSLADGTATTDAAAYGQLNGRIAAQAGSFPSPSEGLLCYRTDLDDLFFYDATTSTWLGMAIHTVSGCRTNSGITTAQYLLGEAADMSTQFRSPGLPWDAKLVKVHTFTVGTVSNTNWIVRRNGSNVVTVNITSSDTYPTGTVTTTDSDAFGAGDMPQIYLDPTPGSDSINSPHATLYFRRRAT